MANQPAAKAARDALESTRRAATDLVTHAGAPRTNEILTRSAKALEERIKTILPNLGEDSFTIVQLRATLAQVQQVLLETTLPGLSTTLATTTAQAAKAGAKGTVDYLVAADKAFRGEIGRAHV